MADKIIITKNGIQEESFTEQEKQAIQQQKLQEQLNPQYQQSSITNSEINMAQAIIDINDRLVKGGL